MDIFPLLLRIAAVLLVVSGIAGMVLPALPGILLVFAGLFIAAWADGFAYVGSGTIIVLGILTILGYAFDFLAGAFGAKAFGAGRPAFFGATAGTIVGLFFGLPGIIFGPFVGAFAAELFIRRTIGAASLAGFGAWIGMVAGIAGKIAVAAAMIGVFVFRRFF
ncbi:hypothetical protein CHL67_03885 [Prosthecochloris sp. GSB1]|uniref:DUF456 domain-containing protein n=1 Tax=Prosthecochloris sp. GSB1 TaxID=281093 RepID=UPI000B8D0E04|nr:DUF456 domain-containing protein [Prosthecochloris sp. GSB1]ASQ90185.1 hypothetical protein CHL67_03885 [Prosthecochloris sp. GSB1]